MTDSYKLQKEAFVSGQTGGTITRINSVCLTAAVSSHKRPPDASADCGIHVCSPSLQTTYALWVVVSPRLRLGSGSWRAAAAEFTILVLPLLVFLTALSSRPLLFNALITALVILIDSLDPPLASPPLSPTITKKNKSDKPPSTAAASVRFSQPFVTIYRAHMMLMTVICILAVDFGVFPREFAKAETWGTSLVRLNFPPCALRDARLNDESLCRTQMDLGVGSFVFSLGVITALPLLRSTDRKPFLSSVSSSAKKSAGVLALGFVRVLMVKGVDYPVSPAFVHLARSVSALNVIYASTGTR